MQQPDVNQLNTDLNGLNIYVITCFNIAYFNRITLLKPIFTFLVKKCMVDEMNKNIQYLRGLIVFRLVD